MRKTKKCANAGCQNSVSFDPNWQYIPNYCPTCKQNYRDRRHPKICEGCGNPFMCHEDNEFRLCATCYEKEQWEEKPCVNCGNFIRYRKSWTYIPERCGNCLDKNSKNRREKICYGCDNTIVYYTNWETVHNYCPACHQARKEGRIELGCLHCRQKFPWNTMWQEEGEEMPSICPKCQNDSFGEIIEAYPSRNSYEVNNTLEYYKMIGVLNHFIHGSTNTHVWTGEFAEKDPGFIIQTAAEIAKTVNADILEFKSATNTATGNEKVFIIKYNIKTFQVVIIDIEQKIIVTTYLLHQGLKTIEQKLNRHEWEKP